jgi:hypothetical protein
MSISIPGLFKGKGNKTLVAPAKERVPLLDLRPGQSVEEGSRPRGKLGGIEFGGATDGNA